MKSQSQAIRRFALVAAVAALLSAGIPNQAADSMKPMKGGEHMLMLQQVQTKQELNALKSTDSMAMVCAKCKTVWVTRVKPDVKGAQILNEHGRPMEVIGTHACTGCKSTLTVVGHARGDVTELKHSCKMCGDDSAFCCATKHDSGPTKGMEKGKK